MCPLAYIVFTGTAAQSPTFNVCRPRKERGSNMMLSPSRHMNSRRKSLGSPSLMDKENPQDLSANRRSNRRKSFDGVSPQSKGLSPQLTPNSSNGRRKSLGFGSPLSTQKENANDLSSNRRSNRRKSLDGVSPRSKGLSPRVTPNGSSVAQVHLIHLRLYVSQANCFTNDTYNLIIVYF